MVYDMIVEDLLVIDFGYYIEVFCKLKFVELMN